MLAFCGSIIELQLAIVMFSQGSGFISVFLSLKVL
uniref:Uncharacterized protein n=1 Tax=Rhizophora mucronata TaxID=61149 RepID=A0A2P2NYH2_RHIMU